MLDVFNAAHAELEAARPLIQDALASAFAQDVTVRRFTGEEVQARALIGQEEDRTADAPTVDEPGISSRSLSVVLQPHAPVQEVGFTVTTAAGQILVPVAVPQNPQNLNLFWVVRMAALAGRTRVEQLVFHVPGEGTVEDPDTGNQVPAPGENLQVPVRLHATTDPRVADMVGADTAEVVLVGRWGTLDAPQARPAGVRWGNSSPLTLDGQPGTLTVKLAYPDSDLAQEQQFGARFVAVWSTRK